MEINWGILQPVDIGGNIQAGYALGQQMVEKAKLKSALAAYSTNPDDPQVQSALAAASPQFALSLGEQRAKLNQQNAERKRIGSYFTNPDPEAARVEALKGGDLDLAEQLGKMGDEHKKQLADMYKGAAPLAYQALKLPYEQRKAYIESLKPQLQAVGWTPDHVDSFDPTDQNLNGIVQSSMTLEQAMNRDEIKYVPVNEGARLVPFQHGLPMSNDTGAAMPHSPATAPVAPVAGELDYTVTPGAKQTSGYRTPEHNHEVGGVANSYHTKLGVDGKPLAHDFVPPAGMSMGQFAADMKARNPHLDVLNEGDHVHIEPRGHASSNQAAVIQHAREAIAAGADPAAVKARAASMGVTL